MTQATAPTSRGDRHHCGNCGRPMKKARRVFGEMPFCDTCYARDFLRRPCAKCGEPAMLHKSQETGLCRKCERLDWTCLRCSKPVERAALLVAGKPVCPSCRRYYPPFPKKAGRTGHATCALCHKHRRVAKRIEGKPYCKLCAVGDRRAEVEGQERSYWTHSLAERQVKFSKRLTTQACRDLFVRFVEAEFLRMEPKDLALDLEHHFRAFEALEKRLPDIEKATETEFLEQFTGDEMRTWEKVFVFLKDDGCAIPSREAREQAAEQRRMSAAVASVAHCHDGFRVAAFAKHLAGRRCTLKTRRVSLRAAVGLVQTRPSDALSQAAVVAYLKKRPGQRAALAAFVGFLRAQGLVLQLPPKKPMGRRAPSTMKDLDACVAILRRSDDYGQLRAAVAGTIVGLFGLELKVVLSLPRTALEPAGRDQLLLNVLSHRVPVDSRLLPGFTRYLALRDEAAGGIFGPLFPGRVPAVSADPSSLGYHFKQWGVSPRDLRVSGRAYLQKLRAAP